MADKLHTGIDLVETERMRMSIEKNAHFLMRFFGEEERKLFECGTRTSGRYSNHLIERISANFAAKEAFAKALGTGVRGFSLKEVQALRGENGEPYLYLTGEAKKRAKGYTFALSLTHTREYAAAVVVAVSNCNSD